MSSTIGARRTLPLRMRCKPIREHADGTFAAGGADRLNNDAASDSPIVHAHEKFSCFTR